MTIPIAANTTCDIYHNPGGPPGAPDVAAVPVYLKPDYVRGQEAGDRGAQAQTWTHVLLLSSSIDIRDSYTGSCTNDPRQDIVVIPSGGSVVFLVIFIERIGRGSPLDHFKVYIDRQAPTWPTDQV